MPSTKKRPITGLAPASRASSHRAFSGNFPGVTHAGSHAALVIDECLFFFRKVVTALFKQPVPLWPATEQLAIPEYGAGFQRDALGFRNARGNLFEQVEKPGCQPVAPDIFKTADDQRDTD